MHCRVCLIGIAGAELIWPRLLKDWLLILALEGVVGMIVVLSRVLHTRSAVIY